MGHVFVWHQLSPSIIIHILSCSLLLSFSLFFSRFLALHFSLSLSLSLLDWTIFPSPCDECSHITPTSKGIPYVRHIYDRYNFCGGLIKGTLSRLFLSFFSLSLPLSLSLSPSPSAPKISPSPSLSHLLSLPRAPFAPQPFPFTLSSWQVCSQH